jgi:hypothetical protein
MYQLGDVALWLLLAAIAGYWWRAHAVRELALAATRAHCRRLEVQLLDETVALRGVRPTRDGGGQLRLRRTYQFEFTSTGDERYRGWTVMLGRRVESIDLQPHRLH